MYQYLCNQTGSQLVNMGGFVIGSSSHLQPQLPPTASPGGVRCSAAVRTSLRQFQQLPHGQRNLPSMCFLWRKKRLCVNDIVKQTLKKIVKGWFHWVLVAGSAVRYGPSGKPLILRGKIWAQGATICRDEIRLIDFPGSVEGYHCIMIIVFENRNQTASTHPCLQVTFTFPSAFLSGTPIP